MSALLALLGALTPAWLKAALSCALALSGVGLFTWLKGKSTQAQIAHEKAELGRDLAENHAVAQKESAATTDEDADAALQADARADRT